MEWWGSRGMKVGAGMEIMGDGELGCREEGFGKQGSAREGVGGDNAGEGEVAWGWGIWGVGSVGGWNLEGLEVAIGGEMGGELSATGDGDTGEKFEDVCGRLRMGNWTGKMKGASFCAHTLEGKGETAWSFAGKESSSKTTCLDKYTLLVKRSKHL